MLISLRRLLCQCCGENTVHSGLIINSISHCFLLDLSKNLVSQIVDIFKKTTWEGIESIYFRYRRVILPSLLIKD